MKEQDFEQFHDWVVRDFYPTWLEEARAVWDTGEQKPQALPMKQYKPKAPAKKKTQESEPSEARLYELRTMPYADYRKTPEWKARRERKLQRSGWRCQVCNNNSNLEVHHRTYERRGNEWDSDLVVLCRKCRIIFHKEGRLAS